MNRAACGLTTRSSCHLPLGRIDCRRREAASLSGRANGLEVNPRGQGPRTEADAARHAPACEARDARGVPPSRF